MRPKLYDQLEDAEKKMIRAIKRYIKLRDRIRRLEKKLDREFQEAPPNAST